MEQERTIRLGTRKSRLAMVQTELFAAALKAAEPGLVVEIVPIVTTGDRIQGKALTEFGGKGVFITEFEEAVLAGTIDAAIHSAKDMPTELLEGLEIAAVLEREDPRDVLVCVKGRAFPQGRAVVGTGSLRRRCQLSERMEADYKLLRGNVNTRLDKLYAGEYDAVVLAAAGLSRLGLLTDERFDVTFFPETEFIPSSGQGIIALETKKGSAYADLFEKVNHVPTMYRLLAERRVLSLLGAGCSAAVGVYSWEKNDTFFMRLMKQDKDDGIIRRQAEGKREDWQRLARELAAGLSCAKE